MAHWEFQKGALAEAVTADLSVRGEDERLARDVMQYGVITVHGQESVYQAVGLLIEKGISGLPVAEGESLVGIISEKDLLRLLYEHDFLPGLVRDYMTESVTCFDVEAPVAKITECLVTQSFRRVPILLKGRLAGVITRADLIRANQDRFRSPRGVLPSSGAGARLHAKDAMHRGLVTALADEPIQVVVDALIRWRVTGVPVVDAGMRLQGVVTEKDLLQSLRDPHVAEAHVGDLMTRDVTHFDEEDSLFDICECLIHNSFRRVPILRDGRLTGIVSRADLMAFILKNRSAVTRTRL